MAITVIDSMMGTGKTQAMYQMIRSNPTKSYMIVTPYLKTIQDAKDAGLSLYEPEYKGGSKMDSLKYLLSHGCNVGCTHSLFLDVDREVWDLIRDSGYTLFIDEALDVVKPINDLIDDAGYRVKKGTAGWLMRQHLIKVDEFCRVTWCGEASDEDYEYRYLEPLIRSGNVLCVGGQLFLWMFPPQIFTAFEDVYILSYLFEGSVFDAYLKIHNFDYALGGVTGEYGSASGYRFTGYKDDAEERKALQELISIYDGVANQIGDKRCDLSVSWYDNATASDIKRVQRAFNTFLKQTRRAGHQGTLMWTAYKREREALRIKGAGYTRKLTAEEAQIAERDSEYKDAQTNKLRCFVSCNARATNDYDDRRVLAYLVNRFYQPLIKSMFKDKYDIKLNENRYALSELVQWIWRSSIRRTALPDAERKIDIFIPSARMRNLLEKWLAGECV